MKLKKYEQLLENAPISSSYRSVLKNDISKARQKYSKTQNPRDLNGIQFKISWPQIQKIPNDVEGPSEGTGHHVFLIGEPFACKDTSLHSQHAQVLTKMPRIVQGCQGKSSQTLIVIDVFAKHLKLCKKLIKENKFQLAELIVTAIHKILEQQLMPQSYLQWKILKIRVVIVRTQIIFSKSQLEKCQKGKDFKNSGQSNLSQKQQCFIQRLPLFCNQIQKDACFPFLEKDFYSFIEVLYFLSAKSLINGLSNKKQHSKLTIKQNTDILHFISKGRICLAKQLEELCIKLNSTQDKKIFNIVTQKSQTLLSFFGLELTMKLTTQILERLSQDEKETFNRNTSWIFQSDEQHDQFLKNKQRQEEMDGWQAQIRTLKMSVWGNYQKIIRKIPNCLEDRKIESVIRQAFLSSREQTSMREGSYQNLVFSKHQARRVQTMNEFRSGPAASLCGQGIQNNIKVDQSAIREGRKQTNTVVDFREAKYSAQQMLNPILREFACRKQGQKQRVEDKFAANRYVFFDTSSSESMVDIGKGCQNISQSPNLLLSPYPMKQNKTGSPFIQFGSKSQSELSHSKQGGFEFGGPNNEKYVDLRMGKKNLQARPSILIKHNNNQIENAVPSMSNNKVLQTIELDGGYKIDARLAGLDEIRRGITIDSPECGHTIVNGRISENEAQNHAQILIAKASFHDTHNDQIQKQHSEITQKRSLQKQKNRCQSNFGRKQYNLRIFRIAKSKSAPSIGRQDQDKMNGRQNKNGQPKTRRSPSLVIPNLNAMMKVGSVGRRKNELIFLPILLKH